MEEIILDAAQLFECDPICNVNSVRSGIAQKKKDSPDVINATNFLVIILKIFP
jgi:hypothetical protein